MSERKVEFSGTMQNTVSETTQSKFSGSGKLSGPPFRVSVGTIAKTVVIAIPISITFSLFTLKMLDSLNIHLFDGLSLNPPIESPPSDIPPQDFKPDVTKQEREHAPQDDLLESRALPINDGYSVIVKTFDKQKDAMGFASKVRQKRINANYFAQEAKYHVYVGPFYAKRSAVSALNAVHQAGFTEAYLQPPYSR
ncbi:SPOR domain-containing protein [bacterium]|nr:SPOR domain-containing protein [bacterium]RIK81858.1 MAG: hypothetical protein DCC62_01335 [candidate division KSB1 bacterium]